MLEYTHGPEDELSSDRRTSPATKGAAPPMSDREVPLDSSREQSALHAWLDGEMPESAVRGELGREVEFWNRVMRQAETMRAAPAPAQLADRIMAAIPAAAPEAAPWWRRTVEVTPSTVMLAGAGLIGVGLVIGAVVVRGR